MEDSRGEGNIVWKMLDEQLTINATVKIHSNIIFLNAILDGRDRRIYH